MDDGIGKGYDMVARAYAARFSNELDDKPFDRDLLDAFARRLAGMGTTVPRRDRRAVVGDIYALRLRNA